MAPVAAYKHYDDDQALSSEAMAQFYCALKPGAKAASLYAGRIYFVVSG